nr:putative reverse transcriptase domain-containing protein [Tanacetum cinerariifolium]
ADTRKLVTEGAPLEASLVIESAALEASLVTEGITLEDNMVAKKSNNSRNDEDVGGDKQEAAFQLLKQKLCSAPILALAEGAEDFVAYCDASHKGLRCCIDAKREGDLLCITTINDLREKLHNS